jgi:pSer/pThr/pTyr-binding forkhead associated (FHA) protein
VVLYGFLFLVARTAWRELRPPTEEAPPKELVVLDPARSRRRRGERILIRTGATVGREEGADVVMDEDTVSARHAVFHRRGRRWWLEDLGSTNGSFINGRPVNGRGPLRDGDEVRFGHVAVRFGPPGAPLAG